MNDKYNKLISYIQANSVSGERWRKYNDNYYVSSRHQVISLYFSQVRALGQYQNNDGYYRVSLQGKKVLVSRLMAETFYSSYDETKEIHHRNGDHTDNRLSNLQPLTKEQHIAEHKRLNEHSQQAESEKPQKWKSIRDWGVFW